MKLCIDCKWVAVTSEGVQVNDMFAYCSHPNALRSYVDGSLALGCRVARQLYRDCDCGPEAKWFEPLKKEET